MFKSIKSLFFLLDQKQIFFYLWAYPGEYILINESEFKKIYAFLKYFSASFLFLLLLCLVFTVIVFLDRLSILSYKGFVEEEVGKQLCLLITLLIVPIYYLGIKLIIKNKTVLNNNLDLSKRSKFMSLLEITFAQIICFYVAFEELSEFIRIISIACIAFSAFVILKVQVTNGHYFSNSKLKSKD